MMSAKKMEVLRAFLGKLPEAVADKLARAVEADRLVGGGALPHDAILESLRPALQRLSPARRRITPLRLFCLPFEDLLSSEPRARKQKGRILRQSIPRVWKWLAHEILPQRTAEFVRDVRAAALAGECERADELASAFWRDAAAALHAALADGTKEMSARLALGDDGGRDDAAEMALMLSVGDEVFAIHAQVPRPIETMTDDILWAYRALYDRLVQTAPDAAPFVSIIAMSRLERPWEALRLPLMISRQTQDTLISSTDMGLVGELLFSDIEMHAAAIRAVRHQEFDPDDLVHHGHIFATLSAGLVKEVGVRRDGKWGQRLLSDRAAIAEVMEGLMERAPREILGVFAMHKGRFGGKGPRSPDISKPLDPEKLDRAMRYARLMSGCRSFAAAGSFGAALRDSYDEVTGELTRYTEELVRELRAAEGETKVRADQYFWAAADLTAIIRGEEEAELLRRRGRAALAA